MISRRVRIQLAVFSALGAIASCLIFFHYTRVPSLLGIGQTRFEADFSNGGGLYPHANVTYRGVTVGKVVAVDLTPSGARAHLSVSTSAHVPRAVTASIKSVSAIGEQYVDLVPRPDAGTRVLEDGDRIGREDTHVPTPIAHVLDSVDTLLKSVPQESLTTVLDEAEHGFRGLGPSLARLTTDVDPLVGEANASYPQTHTLIQDAGPVIDTQIASSPAIRSWASDLNGFSKALRSSDPKLRALFKDVPPAARTVAAELDDLSQQAPGLIGSADVSAELLKAYYPSVEQVLSVYPLVAAGDIAGDSPSNGRLMGLTFKTIANYPGGCSEGWPKAGQPYGSRSSRIIADEDSAPNAYCRINQSDPRVARGARNMQCFEPGSPPGRRAALITQCRGTGYQVSAAPFDNVIVGNPLAPFGTTLLGTLTRQDTHRQMTKPGAWQDLLSSGGSR